jgi:mono/diheme cytochrome c family protein
MTFSWQNALSSLLKSDLKRLFVVFTALSLSFHLFAQDSVDKEKWSKGRDIFRSNCASCHHPVNKGTGPAMAGVLQRWEAEGAFQGISGKEWLYRWIRNNQEVLASGHPYANNLYLEYNKSIMNLFPALTDEDIDAILYFTENHTFSPTGAATAGADGGAAPESTFPLQTFLYILVGALLVVVIILARVSKALERIAKEKSGESMDDEVPIWKSKKLATMIVLAALVFVGYTTVTNAVALGRQQDYAPDQPIKYSHALHAGKYQIECQYCHSAANEGKHSNIPSVNVCMNCHKNIQEGPEYGRKEIAKIYSAIAYSPVDGEYFDTEGQSKEEMLGKLKEYLARDYDSEILTADQQKELDASFAEVKAMFNRPVEWVRIHNMPDHVYFNHAQHVNAGNIECQTCHGAIEEMVVVKQHAPLSMGWCINCHRNTNVDFGSNSYYSVYEKFHEDLRSGKIDKVTVEDIGGTECQKCHY